MAAEAGHAHRRPVLAAAYTLALGVLGVVALSAVGHWTPAIFVQGQGGTPLRHFVLISATLHSEALAIAAQRPAGRHSRSRTRWMVGLWVVRMEKQRRGGGGSRTHE